MTEFILLQTVYRVRPIILSPTGTAHNITSLQLTLNDSSRLACPYIITLFWRLFRFTETTYNIACTQQNDLLYNLLYCLSTKSRHRTSKTLVHERPGVSSCCETKWLVVETRTKQSYCGCLTRNRINIRSKGRSNVRERNRNSPTSLQVACLI